MVISLGTLLLLAAVAVVSGLTGVALALLGAWLWYTARLVSRIERRGELYLSDWDNEQGRKLRVAADVATAMEFMRQTLRTLSPEMAREFTPPAPVVEHKGGKKGKSK